MIGHESFPLRIPRDGRPGRVQSSFGGCDPSVHLPLFGASAVQSGGSLLASRTAGHGPDLHEVFGIQAAFDLLRV